MFTNFPPQLSRRFFGGCALQYTGVENDGIKIPVSDDPCSLSAHIPLEILFVFPWFVKQFQKIVNEKRPEKIYDKEQRGNKKRYDDISIFHVVSWKLK